MAMLAEFAGPEEQPEDADSLVWSPGVAEMQVDRDNEDDDLDQCTENAAAVQERFMRTAEALRLESEPHQSLDALLQSRSGVTSQIADILRVHSGRTGTWVQNCIVRSDENIADNIERLLGQYPKEDFRLRRGARKRQAARLRAACLQQDGEIAELRNRAQSAAAARDEVEQRLAALCSERDVFRERANRLAQQSGRDTGIVEMALNEAAQLKGLLKKLGCSVSGVIDSTCSERSSTPLDARTPKRIVEVDVMVAGRGSERRSPETTGTAFSTVGGRVCHGDLNIRSSSMEFRTSDCGGTAVSDNFDETEATSFDGAEEPTIQGDRIGEDGHASPAQPVESLKPARLSAQAPSKEAFARAAASVVAAPAPVQDTPQTPTKSLSGANAPQRKVRFDDRLLESPHVPHEPPRLTSLAAVPAALASSSQGPADASATVVGTGTLLAANGSSSHSPVLTPVSPLSPVACAAKLEHGGSPEAVVRELAGTMTRGLSNGLGYPSLQQQPQHEQPPQRLLHLQPQHRQQHPQQQAVQAPQQQLHQHWQYKSQPQWLQTPQPVFLHSQAQLMPHHHAQWPAVLTAPNLAPAIDALRGELESAGAVRVADFAVHRA